MNNRIAFLFPGQGSQYAGMFEPVKHCQIAKDYIAQFENQLHYRFDTLKEEELQQTHITQPALYTMSAIYSSLLKEEGIIPHFVAGHSLGEFSALFAAGFFSFYDGLSIVTYRGKLMQEVANQSTGKMAAIIGLPRTTIIEICAECSQYGIVSAVNFNSPTQTVISGQSEALQKACELAKASKAKLVVPLAVSAAFHSQLMAPLRDPFEKTLQSLALHDTNIPIIQNVDAQPHQQKQVIVENLISQLHKPVLWQDSIDTLISLGVNYFVEAGPKKVLTGLMKLLPFQMVISEEWMKAKGTTNGHRTAN
jgi:[acyl-carrier-protein] S-malonyltransferase